MVHMRHLVKSVPGIDSPTSRAAQALALSDSKDSTTSGTETEMPTYGKHSLVTEMGGTLGHRAPCAEFAIAAVEVLLIAVAINEAWALWTWTRCDRQAHVAQRSLPNDDHRFTGPCLRGEHGEATVAQCAELA